MKCEESHPLVEWTQLIPVEVLSTCHTRMPESVLSELWDEADANGEVCEDIPELRPQTLAEMFVRFSSVDASTPQILIESK